MTAHRNRVTALAHTTLDLGHKLDQVIQVQQQQSATLAAHSQTLEQHGAAIARLEEGQARLEQGQARLEGAQTRLEGAQTRLEEGQARVESLLAKLLEGQAVLHQNDMELKRRLDQRGPL